uniref:Arachidonate epidermal lipoxygenase 3 n=1 Tax=Sphenodon punctatus TaxID=8508 RepID=A0A8D0HLK6_SPHPU
MITYQIRVTTGEYEGADTMDTIAITLVGEQGESPKSTLDQYGRDFTQGTYEVHSEKNLGPLLLIRLHKERYSIFPESNWYCSCVEVTCPEGTVYRFPCYMWIQGYRTLELREGKAKTHSADSGNLLLLKHRQEELKAKQEFYRYKEFAPGWPRCLDVPTVDQLDLNNQYSPSRSANFSQRMGTAYAELILKGLLTCKNSWNRLSDVQRAFWFNSTLVSSQYRALRPPSPPLPSQSWRENSGVLLPAPPLCSDQLAPTPHPGTDLPLHFQKGNLFLIDCEILEGVPATELNGHRQQISAPLCLLYLNPKGEMIPIAIQLTQSPGPESPIFVPSDSEWDWTLAKFWVRNGTFHIHEVLTHLLHTHLVVEVFTLATLRQLPMCHPVYKLLLPHTRYTLHINTLGRVRLFGPGGLIDQATATGYPGLSVLLAKGLSKLTYSSLCLPDDLQERGVATLPNYYYKDDGMKLWGAMESFIYGIISYYYPRDDDIKGDPELQAWIKEIFTEGLLGRKSSGFPSSLETVTQLIKLLTMMIYNCSVRHASVNNGQFDFGAWMPNYPSSMRKTPPTTKGTATLENILETLPDVSTTCSTLLILWLLSQEPGDRRPLGHYPDEHFTEDVPKTLIGAFQRRLAEISKEIEERNKSLPLPYTYLYPPEIENSTAI